jgi:membrane protease YdiL (CAAX protease family)
LENKDLQQSAAPEISISEDPWKEVYPHHPLGLVEAIIWMAASTLAQMGVGELVSAGHITLPAWSPRFGLQLLVMLVFTIALFTYWKFIRHAKLRGLGLRLDRLPGDLWFTLKAAIGMGLFYLFAAGVYWVVLQLFFDDPDATFREHLRGAIFSETSILYYVGVMLLFPVFEEIWFRGLLYTPMRRELGRWPAIIILSLLFAFAHSNAVPINQFFGGLIFAYAYERRRTLVAPILLHILGNSALAVVGWALVKWNLV